MVEGGEAHFIGVGAEEQEVEGDGGDQVDEEPAAQVVHGDLGGVRLHLVGDVHVRRAKVYQYVYYERDVHCKFKQHRYLPCFY